MSQGNDHDHFCEMPYTWTLKLHRDINSSARIWKAYFHSTDKWQAVRAQIEASESLGPFKNQSPHRWSCLISGHGQTFS